MTSIMTNAGAISALQTLRTISGQMADVQRQVSSGLRVENASDNAAYWSIATTMRSDVSAMSAVHDSLGLSAAVVDTAYSGMSQAIDVMNDIQSKLVAAHEPGVDKQKINLELDQLKKQLVSIASSASFSGENWLWMKDPSDPKQNGIKTLPASFVRVENGTVSLQHIEIDMTAVFDTDQVFYLISDGGCDGIITNSGFATMQGFSQDWVLISGDDHFGHPEITLTAGTTDAELSEMTTVVDLMTQRMITVASLFGAVSDRIARSTEFLERLSDTMVRGVGRLVDADMNEASTRLKALQTQEQLAVQSLSIANANSESILTLFR